MSSGVSDQLERFIRERLPSYEQIAIVLLLRKDSARAWSAPEVAETLQTPSESTAMRLFLLASNGILKFETDGLPRYRYGPEASVDAMVAELATIYESSRDLLAPIVGGTAPDPLRSFADAFKLKK